MRGGGHKQALKLWLDGFVSAVKNKLWPGEFVSEANNKLPSSEFVLVAKNKLWLGKRTPEFRWGGGGEFVLLSKTKLWGEGGSLFFLPKTNFRWRRGVCVSYNKLWKGWRRENIEGLRKDVSGRLEKGFEGWLEKWFDREWANFSQRPSFSFQALLEASLRSLCF